MNSIKKIIITIVSMCLCYPIQTWANKCPEDVQVIEKGQVANCDGLLMSPEASKKIDETQQDAKYYRELSEKLQLRQSYTDKEINILDQRLKLYVDQSEVLTREVNRKERENNWQKFMYFGLGVFATGIIIYGTSELTR
jgi:hypothetical protein